MEDTTLALQYHKWLAAGLRKVFWRAGESLLPWKIIDAHERLREAEIDRAGVEHDAQFTSSMSSRLRNGESSDKKLR